MELNQLHDQKYLKMLVYNRIFCIDELQLRSKMHELSVYVDIKYLSIDVSAIINSGEWQIITEVTNEGKHINAFKHF